MDITPLVEEGQKIIQSYAGGRFRISGQIYASPVFVTLFHVQEWSVQARSISDFTLGDFQGLIDQAPDIDVVLLGCGAEMAFLPRALKAELSKAGLPVEVMDTGAACRTYNVLSAEGRRVVAALLPA